MSRVGKKPVDLAPGVQVTIQGRSVAVKGPLGELRLGMAEGISASRQEIGRASCRERVYSWV